MRTLLGLCLWASGAVGATLTEPTGTLGTMTADTVAVANNVLASGYQTLLIYADDTSVAGTNSVVVCQQSGDAINWTTIGTSFVAHIPAWGANTKAAVICWVPNPTGYWRVTNTTCNTTCSLVIKYRMAR